MGKGGGPGGEIEGQIVDVPEGVCMGNTEGEEEGEFNRVNEGKREG